METENTGNRSLQFGSLKKAFIIIIVLALLAAVFFAFTALRSESRFALRNAKNALFAVETVGIQHRGSGKSIFTKHSMNGMSEGVEEEVRRLCGCKGELRIIDYVPDYNEVKKLSYRDGHFLVSYDSEQEKDWKVELIIELNFL